MSLRSGCGRGVPAPAKRPGIRCRRRNARRSRPEPPRESAARTGGPGAPRAVIEAPAAPRPRYLPAASALRRIPSRAWWLACWLLLALLPFVTAPGEIIADSKLDLAVNPVGL